MKNVLRWFESEVKVIVASNTVLTRLNPVVWSGSAMKFVLQTVTPVMFCPGWKKLTYEGIIVVQLVGCWVTAQMVTGSSPSKAKLPPSVLQRQLALHSDPNS